MPKHQPFVYSLMDELMASPTNPLSDEAIRHQLTRMYGGLHAMETAEEPTKDDWQVCSDAVNIMESLITMGLVSDTSSLLDDAVEALAMAGKRSLEGGRIRLDGKGIFAVRSILEDYAEFIKQLPARSMISAHRKTERRIREINSNRAQKHDVEIVKL